MRWVTFLFSLVFILAGAARASDPAGSWGREGGETMEDAVVIPGLPYIDSGNTCDNTMDYAAMCPYDISAPDVVYSFIPIMDMYVNIDLCSDGNQYDNALIVYENGWTGNPYDCNADACSNTWTPYAARILHVFLQAGNTYYIVITGYTGVCGNYELLVEESSGPQPVACGPVHVPEGEPELVDGYTDNYNGGCDSTPPVFQDIDWIDDSGCAHLCGVSGWYFNQGQLHRDHDWFVVVADDFQIDITLHSESYTKVKVSGPDPDCASVSWDFYEIFEAFEPHSILLTTHPGDTHWIQIWPGSGGGDPPDFLYDLEICGNLYDVVPTETASWGSLKLMYK